MPKAKKRKGAGKKGKKKTGGKAKLQAAAEKDELMKKMRSFIKAYQCRCCMDSARERRVVVSGQVVQDITHCVEEEKPFIRVMLDPERLLPPTKHKMSSKASKMESLSSSTDPVRYVVSPSPSSPLKLIHPLMEAAAEVHYNYLRCLHVWHLPLSDEDIVSLALSMESGLLGQLKVLELMDTNISMWAVQRLSRPLRGCQLAYLMMDYNRLTEEGFTQLCGSLQNVSSLNTLSLNYCQLTQSCGDPLGTLIAMSQIRELRLMGNQLQTKGAAEFIQPIMAVSEINEEFPMLTKLLMQDNAIDSSGDEEFFGPVTCMRAFRRWIACCKRVEEINIDRNLIGDAGARELLMALQQRKEVGHPAIKLSLTNRVQTELFEAILALSASAAKKKGKKGKKKGKKKK